MIGTVQVRCSDGGLHYFPTVAEAMAFANDRTNEAWKVSFDIGTGERVRLVLVDWGDGGHWVYEPLIVPGAWFSYRVSRTLLALYLLVPIALILLFVLLSVRGD